MASFRFVHAADLHLDTPFEGLGQLADGLRERLRDASLEAFDNLVSFTLRQEAAFLVLAGDIYDGAERGIRAQLRTKHGLERLDAAGIPTFIVHGNHDPVDEGWTAVHHWPESVKVFSATEVESVQVFRNSTHIATVSGISYAQRDTQENLSARFSRPDAAPFSVGVLHCNVGGNSDHSPYSPCTIADLARAGMDYWALGHIHGRQILQEHGPTIAYSGNLQGRSFKSTEQGAKGALLVEVNGTSVQTTFWPLDVARFGEIEIQADTIADIGSLSTRLNSEATDARSDAGGRLSVLRARLTGSSQIHSELARPGAMDELLETARDLSPPDVVWARIKDETQPPIDLELLRARPASDIAGGVLAKSDELLSDPDQLEVLAESLFGAVNTALPQHWIPDGADERAHLLELARNTAISELEQD